MAHGQIIQYLSNLVLSRMTFPRYHETMTVKDNNVNYDLLFMFDLFLGIILLPTFIIRYRTF